MEIERFEKYLKRKIIDAMRNNIVPEDFTCTVSSFVPEALKQRVLRI